MTHPKNRVPIEGRRWGSRKDVCSLAGISMPTLHRIEQRDPNAPRPRRLPTGGVLRDLDAWREYFDSLPTAEPGTEEES